MTGCSFRWLTVGLAASGSAGLSVLTAMMNSAFAYADVSPPLPPPIPVTTEILGGSGNPIPDGGYLTANNLLYVQPNLPGTDSVGLFTPEQLYPLTGVKSLTLDTSVQQGVTILDQTLQPDIQSDTPVGIFGYSQSTIISSLEMQQLDPTGTPSDLPLSFVLAADLMNPNGGLLERFDGLQLPALGFDFYGATPADDFPTTMYTAEYDGFSDFPRYPINFLADLNAVAGILFVHPNYKNFTPDQVTPVADGGQAIQLSTEGPTETTYYGIPIETLPLLDPLRAIPVIGKPLTDLLQPDLQALVNLGYGDPDLGWSTAPADVPTTFGLFPSLSDFEKLPELLLNGTVQGIQDFINDLSNPASLLGTPDSFTEDMETLSGQTFTAAPITSLTDLINAISSAASHAYAALLPTADAVNTVLTSLPTYDLTLFVDSLQNGDLIDAIGLPIAADTGLLTVAGGVEFLVLAEALAGIITAF